jgi:hypothetical protein
MQKIIVISPANGISTDDERGKYKYVDRSGVLKKNSVCRGCMFGRPNEKEEKRRINDRRDNSKKIDPESSLSREIAKPLFLQAASEKM